MQILQLTLHLHAASQTMLGAGVLAPFVASILLGTLAYLWLKVAN